MLSLPNPSEDAGGLAPASSARSARLPPGPDGMAPPVPAAQESRSSASNTLRDAWVALLSRYHLQWFCTLTFANSVHPERAFKTFRKWTNELNRSVHGKRWREHGQGVY